MSWDPWRPCRYQYHHTHFTDELTEAQRDGVTRKKSHECQVRPAGGWRPLVFVSIQLSSAGARELLLTCSFEGSLWTPTGKLIKQMGKQLWSLPAGEVWALGPGLREDEHRPVHTHTHTPAPTGACGEAEAKLGFSSFSSGRLSPDLSHRPSPHP